MHKETESVSETAQQLLYHVEMRMECILIQQALYVFLRSVLTLVSEPDTLDEDSFLPNDRNQRPSRSVHLMFNFCVSSSTLYEIFLIDKSGITLIFFWITSFYLTVSQVLSDFSGSNGSPPRSVNPLGYTLDASRM